MTATYPIQHHSRVCAATGRALSPGEKYHSALFDEAGQLVRKDYSAAGWPGPPEKAFALWTGRVPELHQKRRLTFDDDLLMECFERLAEETERPRVQFRYVLALLLLRRKRLKFEDVRREGCQDYLLLKCPATGAAFEVLDPRLAESDVERVQDEVFKLLGWE
jgi:hypothetical protein